MICTFENLVHCIELPKITQCMHFSAAAKRRTLNLLVGIILMHPQEDEETYISPADFGNDE